MLAGAQVMSPAEPRQEPRSPAALLPARTSASTAPSAISQRARPNQAPIRRPAPTEASAMATKAGNGTRPWTRTSISASRPIPSTATESVRRPSRDGSRRGLTSGGGGGAPRPGYGYGLLTYGPCGANGGRYPVPGSVPAPMAGSAGAANAGGGTAPNGVGASPGGGGGTGVLDRPRPSSASSGDPVSPSAGMSSQAIR